MDDFIDLFGKPLCRIQVFPNNDISLGFGEKVPHHNPRFRDDFYGEWEIGTYHRNWRFYRGREMVADGRLPGGRDVEGARSLELELKRLLDGKAIGAIEEWEGPAICVTFTGDVHLLVLPNEDREDEMFHVFGPGKLAISFREVTGWEKEDRAGDPCSDA